VNGKAQKKNDFLFGVSAVTARGSFSRDKARTPLHFTLLIQAAPIQPNTGPNCTFQEDASKRRHPCRLLCHQNPSSFQAPNLSSANGAFPHRQRHKLVCATR